jgi:hypothetical protein
MSANKECAIAFTNNIQDVINSKEKRMVYDLETNGVYEKVENLKVLLAEADDVYNKLIERINDIHVMEQCLEEVCDESQNKT